MFVEEKQRSNYHLLMDDVINRYFLSKVLMRTIDESSKINELMMLNSRLISLFNQLIDIHVEKEVCQGFLFIDDALFNMLCIYPRQTIRLHNTSNIVIIIIIAMR